MISFSRRDVNKMLMLATAVSAGIPALAASPAARREASAEKLYRIAVASWTFHMPLWRGEMKAVDLPRLVRELDVDAIEWSSKTFRPLAEGREAMFQAPPSEFFKELRRASDDLGVKNPILNAGGPFYLAGVDKESRNQALDYFMQYVEPAQWLGSEILRAELYCNAPHGPGREQEAKKLAMEGLNALLEKTADSGLGINVENHHGISSHPEWLADLVRTMNHPRLGITADTNNFRIDQDMPYSPDPDSLPRYVDRYRGLEILMPFTRWVSTKTYAFDSTGYELALNYPRIIEIIRDAGYSGYLSIEYEGDGDPTEGVRKSVEMLRRLRDHLG